MIIDVVIVSDAKTATLKKVTQNAIRSLHHSDNKIRFNPVIVESKSVKYINAKVLNYDFEFNYNKCLNYAAGVCKNDIILFCNNDLIFTYGFMRGLLMARKMGYDSFSPISPGCGWHLDYKVGDYVIEGYDIGRNITGWCIGMTRSTYDTIGGFDESVSFWYSDNLYGKQLQSNNLKHCLVCNSVVFHRESATLNTLTQKKIAEYTVEQNKIYNNRLNEAYSNNQQL